MREKVILLIPLTYNDGSAVAQPILDGVYDALFALCDGYTIAGEVQGAYRMQTGARQVDAAVEVWVAIDPALLEDLRRLVAGFGSMLGQETMYFERTGATVEFVGPETPGGMAHE